jgi:Cd2+/Zn2+-exporting ATPase/Cu+-exporting ATPase
MLGVADAPTSRRADEDRVAALAPDERRRLARRLAGVLAATGMLAVGLLHGFLFPDQGEIAALIVAGGALLAAIPVLAAGVRGFLARDPNSTVEQLVGLALLAAMAVGRFETAILIPLLMQLGHLLEERSILGARAAIEGLRTLRATHASRVSTAGEERVPVERLAVGDRVVVRPGESVPADGRVLRGMSAVDQSSMTGESMADEVAAGSRVFAGTLNLSGVLEVEVTAVAEATALGRIVELLRQAEQSKPPLVTLIERHAGYYLPGVLLVAAAVLALSQDLTRAIAILVVSCPCALVLASPSAMTAAMAVAVRLGVLIKSTRFLEALAGIDTVILDKTGTVTTGHLEVVEVRAFGDVPPETVLAEAARCAGGSRHPVSRAIAAASGLATLAAEDSIEEVPGRGVVARRNGESVRLGSAPWLREHGVEVPGEPDHLGPVVWLARGARLQGLILLADRPRPGSREALASMRALGVERVVLMTGDREEPAAEVARLMGMDACYARCLPEHKLDVVERERADAHRVMVVGDGVNDALALDRADVGVAMGAMGSDVAVNSADVALMGNDLGRLPLVMRLAGRTRATITQNVLFAAASSLVIGTLAGLGVIGPVMGALVQNVGTFVVIVNSGRLLRFDPR